MFLIEYKEGTLILGFRPWDRMYTVAIRRDCISMWTFDPLPRAR